MDKSFSDYADLLHKTFSEVQLATMRLHPEIVTDLGGTEAKFQVQFRLNENTDLKEMKVLERVGHEFAAQHGGLFTSVHLFPPGYGKFSLVLTFHYVKNERAAGFSQRPSK